MIHSAQLAALVTISHRIAIIIVLADRMFVFHEIEVNRNFASPLSLFLLVSL